MAGGGEAEDGTATTTAAFVESLGCGSIYRSLSECHRRIRDPRQQAASCRHLNRALAECMVAACCPEEAEAVRSLCSSAGTSLKRSQCQGAKIALSVCLSSHQEDDC